jgi:hypothetical protein
MMASSVAAAIILGDNIPQVETKMVPSTTTMAMTNEMHHSLPSTPLSDTLLSEGEGKGNEGKGGGRPHGRRW